MQKGAQRCTHVSSTTHAQPEKLEQLITIFRDSIVPAAQQQKGFVGIKLFVDRATGKGVVVSRWQTEKDMQAGEASGYYQEQIAKVAPFLTAPPVREAFELAAEGGA